MVSTHTQASKGKKEEPTLPPSPGCEGPNTAAHAVSEKPE